MSTPDPSAPNRLSSGATPTGTADRRHDPRLGGCPPLHVGGVRATVHDISRNGICLILEGPQDGTLDCGTQHHLVLTDSLDDSRQEMDAEVVWNIQNRAGLRWVSLTPEQDRWLLARFRAWLGALDGASRR
jgi:hypothetical protein